MNALIFKDPPPLEQIKKNARLFFNNGVNNEDKEYEEARGCVNYIRHMCTNYDKLRYAIRVDKKDENDNPDILALKREVLGAIRERYRELKTECLRQEEWLKNRAAALEHGRTKYFSAKPLAPALDLIGAEAGEVLQLKSRIAELENVLSDKQAELTLLDRELAAMRETGFGALYDELKRLRARAAEGDRLRVDKERYLEGLKSIRAVVEELELESAPDTEPLSEKIRRSCNKIDRSPEALARLRENAAKARASHVRKAAERRAAKAAAELATLARANNEEPPQFQV